MLSSQRPGTVVRTGAENPHRISAETRIQLIHRLPDALASLTHALRCLAPGGHLVVLCANGPRQSAQLRRIVEQHGGTWEELPADTFQAAGTSVRTVLLTMPN